MEVGEFLQANDDLPGILSHLVDNIFNLADLRQRDGLSDLIGSSLRKSRDNPD